MRALFHACLIALLTFPPSLFAQVENDHIDFTSDAAYWFEMCENLNEEEFTTPRFNPATFDTDSAPAWENGPNCNDMNAGTLLMPRGSQRPHQKTQFQSVGVDIGTLVPQGLDLNIFPDFPQSLGLSLRPSLSYSVDSALQRRGLMPYGAPKRWRTHYGELVRMIARQDGRDPKELAPLKQTSSTSPLDPRHALPAQVQTYFINAEGQEISFYPSPAALENNIDFSTNGIWYGDGNHRLHYDGHRFTLQTPGGLTFHFEPYKSHLNPVIESASLHYRVFKVVDRDERVLKISFEDGGNQPTKIAFYASESAAIARAEINYEYEAGLLKTISVPAPANSRNKVAVANTYQFFYPTDGQAFGINLSEQAASGTAHVYVEEGQTRIALRPRSNTTVSAYLAPLNRTATGSAPSLDSYRFNLFTDLTREEIGPLTSLVDTRGVEDQEQIDKLPTGRYFFKLVPDSLESSCSAQNSANFFSLKVDRQSGAKGVSGGQTVFFRHQLDPEVSPIPGQGTLYQNTNHPDMLTVRLTEDPDQFPCPGVYNLQAYPALKPGDVMGFVHGDGNFRIIKTFTNDDFTENRSGIVTINPDALIPDEGVSVSDGQELLLIPADSLERVAMIAMPMAGTAINPPPGEVGFTQKLMAIAYDNDTLNAQEIKKVTIYDRLLNNQVPDWYPLQETEYQYQRLHTLGAYAEPWRMYYNYEPGFDFYDENNFANADEAKSVRNTFLPGNTNVSFNRWQANEGDNLTFLGELLPDHADGLLYFHHGGNYNAPMVRFRSKNYGGSEPLKVGDKVEFVRQVTGKTGQLNLQDDLYTVKSIISANQDPEIYYVYFWEPLKRDIEVNEPVNIYRGENGNAQKVRIGSHNGYVQQELDALRTKIVRYLNRPGTPVADLKSALPPLGTKLDPTTALVGREVTRYGGAYNYTLVTGPDPLRFVNQAQTEPAPSEMPTGMAVWSLADKPFKYTYAVNPDGSGQILDLSAAGLDINPFQALNSEGSRPFKTYSFDTGFETLLYQLFGAYIDNQTHYLDMMPGYPTAAQGSTLTVAEVAAHPENYLTSGQANVPISQFFTPSAKSTSLCWGAEIASYQPVPKTGFDFSTRFVRKENLRVLHGGVLAPYPLPDGSMGKMKHVRTSAFRALWHGLSPTLTTNDGQAQSKGSQFVWNNGGLAYKTADEAGKLTLMEDFFEGRLHTIMDLGSHLTPDPVTLNIHWQAYIPQAAGDHSELGNYSAPFNQFGRIFTMEPLFSYQLKNLKGLDWDETHGHIAFDPRHFVQGKRMGNGGFMAEVQQTINPGTLQIPMPALSAAKSPKAGDVILIKNLFYLIENVQGGYLTLDKGVVTRDNTSYRIYRVAQPGADQYKGFDSYGNMTYEETYIGKDHIVWSADARSTLLPDFFVDGTRPNQISATDADHPDNNDTDNWKYFGRTRISYTATDQGFYLDPTNGNTPADPTDTGNLQWINPGWEALSYRFYTLADYTFSGLRDGQSISYPWYPTTSIKLARPYYHQAQASVADRDFHQLDPVSVAAHDTDFLAGRQWASHFDAVSETTYYDGTENPPVNEADKMFRLQLKESRSYLKGAPQDYSRTANYYDAYGFIWETFQAAYKNGSSPYASGKRIIVDANTGIPYQEINYTGTPSVVDNMLTINRSHRTTISHTQISYDLLRRETMRFTHDADGKFWGPVTQTLYKDALWTVVQAKHLNPEANSSTDPIWQRSGNIVSTNVVLKDGMGRDLCSFTDEGEVDGDNVAFNAKIYDPNNGRTLRSYAENRIDFTAAQHPAQKKDQLGTTAHTTDGFVSYAFDRFGRPWGEVTYNGGAETSRWTLISQDPENAAKTTTYLFMQADADAMLDGEDHTRTRTALNIKRMDRNIYGYLTRVRDYGRTLSGNPALYSESLVPPFHIDESRASEDAFLIKGLSALARADYRFDAFGKPIEAIVGIQDDALQQRIFRFDQLSRLRYESHPEMRVPVVYKRFDNFGNITEVDNAGRLETFDYDAYGNLLTFQAGNLIDTYRYHYQEFGNRDRFPNNIAMVEAQVGDNYWVSYRSTYDPLRNLPLTLEMLHNVARFEQFGGLPSAGSAPTFGDPSWSQALTLTYTYDDQSRIATMTYPVAIDGNQNPTKLTFTYDLGHGKIASVVDATQESFPLDLFGDIDYGAAGAPKSYNFKALASGTFNWSQTLDNLNRVVNNGYTDNAGNTKTMSYVYDTSGRITQINRDWLTFKRQRFTYNHLGHLTAAVIPNPNGGNGVQESERFNYTYDDKGFGNIVALDKRDGGNVFTAQVDLATNQLSGSAYSDAGELLEYKDPQSQAEYDFYYNDKGRLSTVDHISFDENGNPQVEGRMHSYYNHGGIRWLQMPGRFQDAEGIYHDTDEPAVLTFYDGANRVLCEFTDTEDRLDTRWDKSFIYLGEKTALSYEFKAFEPPENTPVMSSPLLAPPTFQTAEAETILPAPSHVLNDDAQVETLLWGSVAGATGYQVEVARMAPDGSRETLIQAFTANPEYEPGLPAGAYYLRARAVDGAWNMWLPITLL